MPQPRSRNPGVPRSAGRNRETVLGRVVGTIEQRRSMLIATNGRSTEYDYLKALKQESWVVRSRVAVVFEGGSPLELVRGAAKRGARDDYDEVWAVCDVDDFEAESAREEASRLSVDLVWSRPCFEVWLILHKETYTAYIENATKCGERLAKILGSWDKTRLDFSIFRGGVEDACRRAVALGVPPAANPSTAMWKVVAALKDQRPNG